MPQRMKPHAQATRRPSGKSTKESGYCDRTWFAIRRMVLLRDAYSCKSCGRVCSEKQEAQIDHIVPKRSGGTNDISNLQTLCLRCHGRKSREEMF